MYTNNTGFKMFPNMSFTNVHVKKMISTCDFCSCTRDIQTQVFRLFFCLWKYYWCLMHHFSHNSQQVNSEKCFVAQHRFVEWTSCRSVRSKRLTPLTPVATINTTNQSILLIFHTMSLNTSFNVGMFNYLSPELVFLWALFCCCL